MFFCAGLWLKTDRILGFYGPSSPIADATCGIIYGLFTVLEFPQWFHSTVWKKKQTSRVFTHCSTVGHLLPDSISAHPSLSMPRQLMVSWEVARWLSDKWRK